MAPEIAVALIGLAGSAMGSVVGVMASARLTQYRLEQLEKKVDRHNQVIQRTYRLETRCAALEEEARTAARRLGALERGGVGCTSSSAG